MSISKKWLKQAEIYLKFVPGTVIVNSSKDAAEEMFIFESTGKGKISNNNAYAVGKKWMDVMLIQYKKDIKQGLIHPFELLADLPDWFLIKVGIISNKYNVDYANEIISISKTVV